MAESTSGPWMLDAAPLFVVVLLVAHVSALVREFTGSTDWRLKNRTLGERRIRDIRGHALIIAAKGVSKDYKWRGLSSFFSGKSKSFSSLSDMGNTSTNNLAKTENSFNKRRRIRMASKAKRASYTSFISLSRPPLPPPPSPPSLKDHILEEGDKEGI
ncbi:hypothetical protein ZIOFF_052539 [Zingiber officinale]|uniref:Uncharacterized protein n=1 Tax=Zingiber officinale TaxID=94328 RepID=A0A8J5FNR0_ZINOF|nr:hypothetical protein ZIOFF_052539 [Zingiber officinale]